MPTVFELAAASREQLWINAGVSDEDISFARKSGIDGRDVRWLRAFSGRGYALIMRCPKPGARIFHGIVPAKPMHVKKKTGDFGFGAIEAGEQLSSKTNTTTGISLAAIAEQYKAFVSDYDMMSVWAFDSNKWRKIFISPADGKSHGSFLPEAKTLVKALNEHLVSRIQHGCQDDFHSPDNPGVAGSRMAAFVRGKSVYIDNANDCKNFYGNLFGWIAPDRIPLAPRAVGWVYDSSGAYDASLVVHSNG